MNYLTLLLIFSFNLSFAGEPTPTCNDDYKVHKSKEQYINCLENYVNLLLPLTRLSDCHKSDDELRISCANGEYIKSGSVNPDQIYDKFKKTSKSEKEAKDKGKSKQE
jgi:hypothetical protein